MRRWRCQKTNALLEGEPLVILTILEDDEEHEVKYANLWFSQKYGKGITKSQSEALLDELKFQKEINYLLGIDLWNDYDDEDYWGEEYYLPEWYEDERHQW